MELVRFRTFKVLLLLLLACPTYAADQPQRIDWDNLVPDMPELDNPFEMLSTEQIIDFETLVEIRDFQRQQDMSKVNETFKDGIETRYKLERQGLDVDALFSDYERLEREIASRNKKTNRELDGRTVRIPGYALPLEHLDTGVQELLLVPYVGACIHVPPPPSNQAV